MLNKFSVYGLWHAFFHLLKKVNTNSMPHSLDTGIPEGQGRRAMAWRILLNYLPESRASWTNYLKKQRDLYHQFLGKSSKWSIGSNRLLCFYFSIQRTIFDKAYFLFRRNNHSTSNQSGRRRSSFKSQSKQPMAVFF